MRVLVLNGSPKKVSDTMRLTNAFLEGLNHDGNCDIEIINVINKNIKPCLGCFTCWKNMDGKCIQHDDQNDILAEIRKADILIWSFPLYYFSLPSHIKAVMDRTLPFAKIKMRTVNDSVVHESQVDLSKQKRVVISGAGFPSFENNFKALKQLYDNLYGSSYTSLFVCEAPLLNVKQLAELVDPLLDKIKAAGKEFYETGKLSQETVIGIETPMVPREVYIRMVNQN